jgi:hypothetical protein
MDEGECFGGVECAEGVCEGVVAWAGEGVLKGGEGIPLGAVGGLEEGEMALCLVFDVLGVRADRGRGMLPPLPGEGV